MKKFYFLSGLMFCFLIQTSAQSQVLLDLSLDHVSNKAKAWNLIPSDYQDAIISSEVYSKHNGVTHIYLNQTYKGVPIHNAITTISVKDGKVISAVNNFYPDIERKIKGAKSASLTASQAVYKAAKQLEIASPNVSASRTVGDKTLFDGNNISREEIPVQAMYQMTPDGHLLLSWDLSISMIDNPNYWSIRIDASTGEIIDKDNWTVYCQHDNLSNHTHVSGVCQHNKRTEESTSSAAAMGASYRVYELPAESPIHGDFVTVTDPHYTDASPFGWHDTNGEEGPEFTITRGNNVHAYLDDLRNNDSQGGEPDGGQELIFDFIHDTSAEPLESKEASQVNLFYMNNMMHDLMYRFGFDEAGGNFQATNYSGQGIGGDYVRAESLDDASIPFNPNLPADDPTNGSRNNANFATPPDGSRPRMQMYVWQNSSDVFKITSPSSLSGVLQGGEVGISAFGEPINSNTNVSGELAIARGGSFDSPTQACGEIINGADIAGKIAIVDRGLCDFSLKAYNVQQAGAIGCIIVNVPGVNGGTGEEIINPAAGDNATQVTIPTIFIKTSDGNTIKGVLEAEPVTGLFKDESTTLELDGDFDNGIIAHEYGHGISTRLTGGPNISCLGNAEQMGEGWSDFFSLITTVEDGDQGSDRRGIGTFANGETRDGGGIRQFPYSTDMSINPHTYGDVTSANGVHAVGSIWCVMLWDLYWAMVEKYGYNNDWTNTESGNFRAIQLVMDGMKFQGCSPGFIQGRQGVLDADNANYNGENEELIWTVFARRGLGFFADGGSSDNTTDGEEDFNLPPLLVEELKITRASKTLVKPGETFEVTLDIVNHIPSAQENVVVTDDLEEGLVYLDGSASVTPVVSGNTLTFDLGTLEYEEEMQITYNVQLNADAKSQTILIDDFEEDLGWEDRDLEGSGFSWFNDDVGVDETSGWGVDELNIETDQVLTSPTISVVGDAPALRFWHMYEVSNGQNGGFVQISNNDGLTFRTVQASQFVRNGYSRELQYGLFAIPALDGFTGSSGGEFIDSYIDLSDYKGEDILVRYRFGSQDMSTPAAVTFPGWYIDDFELMDLKTFTSVACIGTASEPNQNCSMNGTVADTDGLVDNDEQIDDYFGVRVYPNPAEDYISVAISSPSNETAQVRLINVDGRVVFTSTRNVQQSESVKSIITRDFAPGMYIVEVRTNNKVTTKKAILK